MARRAAFVSTRRGSGRDRRDGRPLAVGAIWASLRMFCCPLKTAPSGMNAHVIARRRPFVMLAPAPWIVRPLWNEQLPAAITPLAAGRLANCGYTSKIAPDVLTDLHIFGRRLEMGAGEEVQATVCLRRVVERDPDRDRVPRRERPVRRIEMEGGRVGIWPFDQGLIVPDPDSIDPGQLGRHASDAWIENEVAHRFIGLPQIDQLIEDPVVELGLLVGRELASTSPCRRGIACRAERQPPRTPWNATIESSSSSRKFSMTTNPLAR